MRLRNDILQGTEQWLDWKLTKLTATDSSIIAGDLRRFGKTPLMLWVEKIKEEYQIIENEDVKRGKALEPLAREKFTLLTGIDVYPICVESSENDWAAASLDGLSYDGKYIVEIKCPRKISPEPAPYYNAQFQKQLYVSDLDWLYYFCFDGTDGYITKVHRDDNYIKKMIEREERFWNNVRNLEPPEECIEDFATIEDDNFKSAANRYIENKKLVNSLLEQQEKIKMELIERANDQNCIGGGIKMQKIFRMGNIDYKSIPQLQEIDLNQYRKDPIQFWQIKETA